MTTVNIDEFERICAELKALQAELVDKNQKLIEATQGLQEAAVLIKDMAEALKTCQHYASVGQCLPAAEYRRLFPEEGK